MIDTTNWQFYYKTDHEHRVCTSNMLYVPKMNPEKTVLCMDYNRNDEYGGNKDVPQDLIDYFFAREVKYLKEIQHLNVAPSIVDIEESNNRIFIEWNKNTLSQYVYQQPEVLDAKIPNWREQIQTIVSKLYNAGYYKMSLYPHCFIIDKTGLIKTIDCYAIVSRNDPCIERKLLEPMIGKESSYRFDESTNNGLIDFKKFFEITVEVHLNKVWPDNPLLGISRAL